MISVSVFTDFFRSPSKEVLMMIMRILHRFHIDWYGCYWYCCRLRCNLGECCYWRHLQRQEDKDNFADRHQAFHHHTGPFPSAASHFSSCTTKYSKSTRQVTPLQRWQYRRCHQHQDPLRSYRSNNSRIRRNEGNSHFLCSSVVHSYSHNSSNYSFSIFCMFKMFYSVNDYLIYRLLEYYSILK